MTFWNELKVRYSLAHAHQGPHRNRDRHAGPWHRRQCRDFHPGARACCYGRWSTATRTSLIYIRQSAHGIGVDDIAFSVPEIQDLRSRVKTLSSFGDFSTIGFTMVGLGEPREVRAGVVGGSYFDVMGLRPVLGRLLDMRDDGPARPARWC